MAQSNWGWLRAVNPDVAAHESRWVGKKPYNARSSRYGTRLGSFWDRQAAYQTRVRNQSGKIVDVSQPETRLVKGIVIDPKTGQQIVQMVPVSR